MRPDRRMTEFQTQSRSCVSWKSFISAEGSDSGGSSPAHCSQSQSLAGRGLGLDLLHIPFPVNHTHFPRKSFGGGCAAATSAVLPVQSSPCRSPGVQAQPGHRTCLSKGCFGAGGVQAKFFGPPSLPSHHARLALCREEPVLTCIWCQMITLGMHHPIWAGKWTFLGPVPSWTKGVRVSPRTDRSALAQLPRTHPQTAQGWV